MRPGSLPRRRRSHGRTGTATILVLAKAPRPGRVKTRLQTRFSPSRRPRSPGPRCWTRLDAVQSSTSTVGCWSSRASPARGRRSGSRSSPSPPATWPSGSPSAFEAVLPGGGPALLVGMDTPQLDAGLLEVDWSDTDAVLGLTEDGGYWALGLREAHPRAVRGIPMSRSDTGAPSARSACSSSACGCGCCRRCATSTPRTTRTPSPGWCHAAGSAGCMPAWWPMSRPWPSTRRRWWAGRHRRRPATPRCSTCARWQAEPDDVDRSRPRPLRGPRPRRRLWTRPAGRRARRSAGSSALGIDVSRGAVAQSEARGAAVLRRPVESRLPGEGRWGTVLLMDGNLGIGGDPIACCGGAPQLVRPGGLLLVEADPELRRSTTATRWSWLPATAARPTPLPWARLGLVALARRAVAAGLLVVDQWESAGRCLRRACRRFGREPRRRELGRPGTAITPAEPSGDDTGPRRDGRTRSSGSTGAGPAGPAAAR